MPVHLYERCSCGGKWRVVSLSVKERMQRRLGRSWLVKCERCGIEAHAITPKQEREARDARDKAMGELDPGRAQLRMRFDRGKD